MSALPVKKLSAFPGSGEEEKRGRYRFTLTSRKVKELEKVCDELIKRAKGKKVKHSGPARLPTKVLRITTRKGPAGQGTNTWDRFELRIHKRVIDLVTSPEILQGLVQFPIDPSVEVEVMEEPVESRHA